ncbi:hypothetical protein [Sinobaca sp. H24]|uniref:hypothetical protein n=1 Tax=Sinobaca sp. H24 TaxID=2923376 RepID=UPI00207957F9|nr:hypothetical protein [Sinobaca sp. H24]
MLIRPENKTFNVEKDDLKISLALMGSFVILTIQFFVLIYFDLLDTPRAENIQLISKILVGLAFLYAFPSVVRRNKILLLAVYFISILLFIIHYFIFPQNQVYIIGLIFPFFFTCLPAFLYSFSIYNWRILEKL